MMMDPFPTMSKYLKPMAGKKFKIVHYKLTEEKLKLIKFRDMIHHRNESMGQKPGTIVQLCHKNGKVIMADTEMERRTNKHFLLYANGDVLIGGLGLGMILLAAQAKKEVNSITVVERHQEVIDLVVPQLPLNGKVNVICGDIFEWYPPVSVKYDTMYFDVWDSICGDNYEEMKTLHRRFARRLNRDNPNYYMSCWRHEETKRLYKNL
jgi:spermidine synthase